MLSETDGFSCQGICSFQCFGYLEAIFRGSALKASKSRVSLPSLKFIAQRQLCSKIFWPRHPGDPRGSPQAPPVSPRIPPDFRQRCWWKCTSKPFTCDVIFFTWNKNPSKSFKREVASQELVGDDGKKRIIISWDDSFLDKGCPQKQHFLKAGLKAYLESLPWNEK